MIPMGEDDEESWNMKDNWAVVYSGNHKYVGKVSSDPNGDPLGPENNNGWVTLNPCFEYMSDLQFAQVSPKQVAITGRSRVMIPFDHTLQSCPVHCQVSSIAYFEEMGDEDRKGYQAARDVTLEKVEELRRQRDGSILVVPGSAMPKGGPPRSS